jgi:hypothetical protein
MNEVKSAARQIAEKILEDFGASGDYDAFRIDVGDGDAVGFLVHISGIDVFVALEEGCCAPSALGVNRVRISEEHFEALEWAIQEYRRRRGKSD